MAKVWNITDHPLTELTPRVMMVLGRSIRPGKCINVPDDRLAGAHKVHKAVLAKKLFIGRFPPQDYMDAKRPPRTKLADGVNRSHGLKAEPKAPEKETLEIIDTVEVKEEVTAELESSEEPMEPPANSESVEDKDSKKKGKKRRGY